MDRRVDNNHKAKKLNLLKIDSRRNKMRRIYNLIKNVENRTKVGLNNQSR